MNDKQNTCCHCKHSEGIEGRNAILGCIIDKKLHDMDDKCRCFEACYKFDLKTGLPVRSK